MLVLLRENKNTQSSWSPRRSIVVARHWHPSASNDESWKVQLKGAAGNPEVATYLSQEARVETPTWRIIPGLVSGQ